MKVVIYIVVAAVGFCAVAAATLYFKGGLNKETIANLRRSVLGSEKGNQGQTASQPGQPLLPLATALREKEKQLAQREDELGLEEERIKGERAALESERKKLEELLKRMEIQLAALDQDEAKRLSDLAKTYQEMQPAKAAAILDQMSVDHVVKILGQITKAKDRAKIVESMKKSLQISEALISGTGN